MMGYKIQFKGIEATVWGGIWSSKDKVTRDTLNQFKIDPMGYYPDFDYSTVNYLKKLFPKDVVIIENFEDGAPKTYPKGTIF